MSTPMERLDAAEAAYVAARIELDQAKAALLEDARRTGATQYRTDRLTVSVVTRRDVDPDRLLAWTRANRPDQLTEAVQPAFKRAFTQDLRRDGDDWVTIDGEVIDWAGATEYLSVRAR